MKTRVLINISGIQHLWHRAGRAASEESFTTAGVITFLPEPSLWSLISPQQTQRLFCCNTGAFLQEEKEASIKTSSQGRDTEGGGGQHLLRWQTVWAGWAASAHWTSHMISQPPPPRPGPASAWMLGWLGQFPVSSCLNQLFTHTNNFCSRLCCHNKLKWQLKKPKHLQSLMFCPWLCVVTCVLCCSHIHFGWDETNNKTTNGSISIGTIKLGRQTFPRTQLRHSKCLYYVRRYLRRCDMNMSYNFNCNSQLFAPHCPCFPSKNYN